MKTSQIIQCLTEDGLTLSVSDEGNLKILGDQDKIDNWIETIKENKAAILSELDTSGKSCHRQILQATSVQQPLNECSIDDQQKIKHINNELTSNYLQGAYKELASPFETQSNSKYSVTCTDASTDPVLVEVTIAGQASFTMEIPQRYYDGLALLELLEQHNTQAETHSVISGLSKETEGIDSRRAA